MESTIQTIVPSCTQSVDLFTLNPYSEDGWSRVKSRKCCTESEALTGVNWVDVDSENHGK